MTGREWSVQHVESARDYAERNVDQALSLIDVEPGKARESLFGLLVAALQDGAAAGYNAGWEAGYWEGMCDS